MAKINMSITDAHFHIRAYIRQQEANDMTKYSLNLTVNEPLASINAAR